MKHIYSLSIIFLICASASLTGQISIDSELNIQLNSIDTIASENNMMIDQDGKLHHAISNQIIESNHPIPLNSEYANYGAGYEDAYYYKDEHRVYLGGLVRKITSPFTIEALDVIGTLPLEYRPAHNVLVKFNQQSNILSGEIRTDGTIFISYAGNDISDFLSLEGISFYRDTQVGDYVAGGYLFYKADPYEDLDGDGDLDKGLIAADENTAITPWGCFDIDINADSTAVGYGYYNSNLALDVCDFQSFEAVKLCDDLVLNGYDDWFLPSNDELKLIWENLVDWDGNGMNDGNTIGDFPPEIHWSSTEFVVLENYCRGVKFSNGNCTTGYWVNTNRYVRAVRVWD